MKKILVVLLLLLSISCFKQEENKIRLVLDWMPNTNHSGIFVAKEKGYFKEEGLDVEILLPPESSVELLVATSKAEFGISFQDSLAKYFSKEDKLPISAIATILQHNTSGLVSLKEKGIDTYSKLEGKTYATWDDPIEQAIIAKLMEKEKASFSKVNIIPYSWDLITSLKTETDAAWIYYAWDGIALEKNNIEFNFLEAKQIEELNYYTPVIISNNEYMKNNSEIVKKFLKAIEKGYRFAIENPEETSEILVKNYPELDKELVLLSQKWINNYYLENDKWGYIESKRWNNFYTWLYENNLIENPIEKDFGFTNEYLGY